MHKQSTGQPVPFDPGTGPIPGYYAGQCGHRVAEQEWRAGFRVCERCPAPAEDVTAIVGAVRGLLAAGWVVDTADTLADGTVERYMDHPSGRAIVASTDTSGTTDLTLKGLSLSQVARAITGAGLVDPAAADMRRRLVEAAEQFPATAPGDRYCRTPGELAAELYEIAALLDGLDGLPLDPIRPTLLLQAMQDEGTPDSRSAVVNILADNLGMPAPVTRQFGGSRQHAVDAEVGRVSVSVFTHIPGPDAAEESDR